MFKHSDFLILSSLRSNDFQAEQRVFTSSVLGDGGEKATYPFATIPPHVASLDMSLTYWLTTGSVSDFANRLAMTAPPNSLTVTTLQTTTYKNINKNNKICL
ncbi:hypothetical protein [Pleionea litopenaei]|uniref:Uncharacterized protein n=1 Tax=Pleionea litopenaei TaxID=3070815 RepID=A0AA51X5G0_9GAMM|nr:hypothetical protein [Pleionea sp. HL-JVS1]WMS86047.1 hypothetical protein Q9312_12545 [Pleionea sp. HL-JVS1]